MEFTVSERLKECRKSLAIAMMSLFAPILSAAPPTYLNHRAVILAVESATNEPVEVELFVSTPTSPAWERASYNRLHEHAIRYVAPNDGRYDFFLVLTNQRGQSSPTPVAGSAPHASIVVDTLPPLLQIHGVSPLGNDGASDSLRIELSFIEDHAAAESVRAFYRSADTASWIDGGALDIRNKIAWWKLPPDVSGTIDLNIVAADRAGNRTTQEVLGVSVSRVQRDHSAAKASEQTATPSATPEQSALSGPTKEPVAEAPIHFQPVAQALPPVIEPAPATHPVEDDNAVQLAAVRKQAQRFVDIGDYPLALARLGEALEIKSDDAELYVLQGTAYFWSGDYANAAKSQRAALALQANHVPALEGLSLVAATTGDYRTARELLTRLTQLEPESGAHLLRLGDVTNRLGNTEQAIIVWRKLAAMPNLSDKLRTQVRKRLETFGPGSNPE